MTGNIFLIRLFFNYWLLRDSLRYILDSIMEFVAAHAEYIKGNQEAFFIGLGGTETMKTLFSIIFFSHFVIADKYTQKNTNDDYITNYYRLYEFLTQRLYKAMYIEGGWYARRVPVPYYYNRRKLVIDLDSIYETTKGLDNILISIAREVIEPYSSYIYYYKRRDLDIGDFIRYGGELEYNDWEKDIWLYLLDKDSHRTVYLSSHDPTRILRLLKTIDTYTDVLVKTITRDFLKFITENRIVDLLLELSDDKVFYDAREQLRRIFNTWSKLYRGGIIMSPNVITMSC